MCLQHINLLHSYFRVVQAFRLHLIENALQILVKPGCQMNSLNGDQVLRKTKIPDVLSYVQLIMENSVLVDMDSRKSPINIIGHNFIFIIYK